MNTDLRARTTEHTETIVIDTPIGPLTVVASDRGLRAVLWPAEDAGPCRASARRPNRPPGSPAAGILQHAADQLADYFDGRRTTFDVPLDPIGTDFQQAAWAALRTIPYGETISYGEQAARLGDRRKARAVGAANGRNPISIIVPCHRVVGSTGALTGFAGGLDTKAWLLDHERLTLFGPDPRVPSWQVRRGCGAAADWAATAGAFGFLLGGLRFGPLRLHLGLIGLGTLAVIDHGGGRGRLVDLRQGDQFVALQQVADDRRGGRIAGDGGGQHDAHAGDAVALDEAGQHVLELIGRRILGVVAELLDAVGKAGVGEDGRDRLHAAVDPTGLHGGPDTVGVERLDERFETLAVVVVEGFDGRRQLVVGGRLERAVDQAERLHPVLHLVHAQRRYRAAPPLRPGRCGRGPSRPAELACKR